MKLTERQKKHLRREAHALKPLLSLGDKGITAAFLAELDSTLEHHELLKVKIRSGDRNLRDQIIADLLDKTGATLVSRIGNIATFYRPRSKNPRISLPAPG